MAHSINPAETHREATRLRQAEERRLAELRGLADIASASAALTDLGETYRRVTETVARLMDAERCLVLCFSDDLHWAYAESPGHGFQEEQISRVRFSITPEIQSWAESSSSEALVLNDLDALPPPLADLGRKVATENALVAFLVRRDQIQGALVASNKDGGFCSDDATLLSTVAHHAAIAIENARLFQSEQARRRQLEGLQATIAALSAELHLDPLLQLIAEQAAAIFDAPAAAVLMWDEERETMIVRAQHGLPADFVRRLRLPYKSILNGLGRSPDSDLFTVYDLSMAGPPKELITILGAAPDLLSALMCALQLGGQLAGTLIVYSDYARHFQPDEKALARTLAQQAAIAIENAQLYTALHAERERLRALSARMTQAQEAERTRIARELHDEAGQSLTAVGLQLDFATSILPTDVPAALREQIDEAKTLVKHTLEEIRRISIDLRPSLLDDLGLTPALRWHCERFSRHTNLKVRFESEGDVRRLDPDIETAVYRAAQEALTNVARHAQATEARISLDFQSDGLRLLIADNGRGFKTADEGLGVGLMGMQERIALIGGELHINSLPGSGSALRIEVPLKRREEGS